MVWRKRIILNEASLTIPFGETEDMHKSKLKEFETTLQMFPHEMQQEYLEAKRLCPLLVEKESDPIAFLRREDFQPLPAVLRMVMYWRIRKEVFGEHRFNRPMTLGPEGVFASDEIDLFATGYLTLLPPDVEGSPVLFFDLCRQSNLPSQRTLIRHMFYLAQSASANPASQKQGLIFIFVVNDKIVRELENLCKQPLETMKKALPMKVKKMCFLPCLYHGGDETALKSLELNLLRTLKNACSYSEEEAVPVFGSTQDEILSQLVESHGLSKDSLPATIGGEWSWSKFSKFLVSNGHKDGGKPPVPTVAFKNPLLRSSSGGYSVGENNDNNSTNGGDSSVVKGATPPRSPKLSPSPGGGGGGGGASSSDLLISEVLKHIPRDEVVDYLEAKMRVPVLVEHESPFSRFLACENNNNFAAARRLASYWRERRLCYGERAFLPLNISGQGAMTQEDMGTLVSGSMFLLPDDRIGRPVICIDLSRNSQKDLYASALRIWFYCLHVASENPKSQFEGIVCLCILSKAQQSQLNNNSSTGDSFISALPVRLNMVHVLLPDEPLSWTGNIDFCIPSQLPFVGTVRSDTVSVSAGENILERLEAYGLTKASLPIKIGGTWDHYADLKFWLSQRNDHESEEFQKLVTNHSEGVYGAPDDASSLDGIDSAVDSHSKGRVDTEDEEALPPYIHNGLDGFTETKAIMKKGLADMEDAIAMLPEEDKEALLEVREKAPDVCEKEAPPIRYLRFENYNTWAGAQRLALHWKLRKEVFGDRYMLPMNLSGEGTLIRDDVASLGSGYLVFLPYDKKGRTVLCYDPGRISDRAPEVRARIAFYIWNIVAENPISQQDGVKLLLVQRSSKIDAAAQKKFNFVIEAYPVRYESLHIVNCPEDSERKTFLESLVPAFLRFLGLLAQKTTVHVASTKEEVLAKLTKHDLSPEGIPESLGGSWNYDTFAHWLELRTRYEWDLPVSGSKKKSLPHIPAYNAKPRSQLSDVEKVERKRRLNVLNSRRKRERVKVEVEVFHEQVVELQNQNHDLRMETKRLEECIAAAMAEVAKAERSNSERTQRARLRPHPSDASQPSAPAARAAYQDVIDRRMIENMLRDQVINGMSQESALSQQHQQFLGHAGAGGESRSQSYSMQREAAAQQQAYTLQGSNDSKRRRAASPKPGR